MKKTWLFFIACFSSLHAFSQLDTTVVDTPDQTNLIRSLAISADVLEGQQQTQDVSGLLQASRDVFTNVAGFNFSSARFRMRGYDSENFSVMMGGVPVNDPENGRAIWANWGGLNDITRYQYTRTGLAANPYTFSGIGGFSNIEVRASKQRKGTKISLSETNRTYRHRIMLTHNTGMMKNGLSVSASVSTRFSEEGYVEGTFQNGMSYFLSLEKKINDRHSLGLVALGSPTVQARSGLAVQEAYDLTGDNYYNPYWGFQNGEKRNARVRDNHKPYVFLTHYFTPNDKTTLNTTAYAQFGKGGSTNLNWYDAPDPRPDYYRYLPSYYALDDPDEAARVAELWRTDDSYRQLNWDFMNFANGKNLYSVVDAEGEIGNTITGNRSKYIVENYRQDPLMIGLNSVGSKQINSKLTMTAGANLRYYKSRNFRQMVDLLGGDFWVDVDQFAEQDFADPNAAQNDLENPNNVIYEGDAFGYNYDININKASLFYQAEYRSRKIDAYGSVNVDGTSFWRTGNYRNGRFPDNSFGDSEKQNFLTYGIKAGAVYKVTGRHFVSANAAYLTRPPSTRDAFLSPRVRHTVLEGLSEETLLTGDINYEVRYPNLKARVTAYYTEINDQVWNRSFYHDELRTFVNYSMTGMDHLHTGLEAGIEGKILQQQVTLQGAAAFGQYIYNSRPTGTIAADNSSEVLAADRTIFLQNFRLGGMPHVAASFGAKYSGRKFWFIGFNINWFDEIYLDPNPDRRTTQAVEGYVTTDPQWSDILDQTKLDSDFTVNAFAGKSWKLWDKYYLLLTVNATNLLNNKNFRTGGFEQLRYDRTDIDRFPARFGYMYGTTYFGMVRLSF